MAISCLAAERLTLYKLIAQKSQGLPLQNMRIEKINDLFIAIDTSSDQALQGKIGTVYPAYPIDCDGNIHMDIELMAKIVPDEEKSQENIIQPQDAITAKKNSDSENTWHRTTPQKAWVGLQREARQNSILFSSKATRIAGGMMIVMAKVPGVPLLDLIGKYSLKALTPLQRISLAINVITSYEKLHAKGIFHRDVSASNILIYLPTLQAIPIDINGAYDTELTKAPEDAVTEQSDIYSIAQDIFMPIFSGIRPKKNKIKETGEITEIINMEEIKKGINNNFIAPGLDSISEILEEHIIALLDKMHSEDPQFRGTLEDAKKVLEELKECLIETCSSMAIKNQQTKDELTLTEEEYNEQLGVLNKILNDDQFKIRLDHIKPKETIKVGNSALFFHCLSRQKGKKMQQDKKISTPPIVFAH